MGRQESPQLIERKTQVDTDAQETSRASKYYRKICCNLILIYHENTYAAVVKKTHPPSCFFLERPGRNAPGLRRPCLPGLRSRMFLGGVRFLRHVESVSESDFCPTPQVQLNHFFITLCWKFLLKCYNFF